MPEQAVGEDWMSTTQAGGKLGYSATSIWRLCRDGDLPNMRAGKEFRVPAQLVKDACDAVRAGGSIDLVEFAREWAARNALAAGAVA